jgi:hypothetical protein
VHSKTDIDCQLGNGRIGLFWFVIDLILLT